MLCKSLSIFQSLFEDTIINANFLKSHICNISCIEVNTLVATLKKKVIGKCQRQIIIHSTYKRMDPD